MIFAREAITLCVRYLKRAYDDGSDIEARTGMCYASIYAALSYGSAGLNAVHGIAYAVAGVTHHSHGTTNAVMLPYVLEELGVARAQELGEVASIFGITAVNRRQAIGELSRTVRSLIGAIGIPTTLKELGIQRASLPLLLDDALRVTRLAKAFPVPDVKAAYARILQNSYEGDLGKSRAA
jgi:alcohol dehydrogenase